MAQSVKKTFKTYRVERAPRIDGKLDDIAWQNVEPAKDFRQREPYQDVNPSQPSEVKIVYDDEAIYVAAKLYDSSPDSILKELSIRDQYGNTDWFSVHFDTFHDLQNRFEFGVTAAGVQFDEKTNAETFDVVWESEVRITTDGWNVEMKIPYAALRFPDQGVQTWGLQLRRSIRRYRELDIWQYISPDIQNVVSYYGDMTGIENIKSPIRLSFTPYVGFSESHYPYDVQGKSNWSSSYNAGLDLKYGINESFTLDMTLAPDFGQVQSDNQILNLSAFEVQFQENRPFFIEGTELFNLPNLFYARRIGGVPSKFFDVESMRSDSAVTVVDNPQQVQLINATKVTGRTPGGLGIGFLNAVTAETNATIKNLDGSTNKIQTEPLSNYNAVAINQTLKNNSSFSFMNTNVTRFGINDDANVTGMSFVIGEKKDRFRVSGFGAYSLKTFTDSISDGFTFNLALDKVSGNWKFGVFSEVMNETYDPNDMGILFFANQVNYNVYMNYNQYKPNKYFLRWGFNANNYYSTTFVGSKFQEYQVNVGYYNIWKNWMYQYFNFNTQPLRKHDFYEPREPGRVFIGPSWYGFNTGISTDYRKTFALDVNVGYYRDFSAGGVFKNISVGPIIRFSDKLKFSYMFDISNDYFNQGYSTRVDSFIYFAFREVNTTVNTMNLSYIFNKNASLTFRGRYYWSTVEILDYKLLNEDGNLGFDTTNYQGNNNFNVNFFNIDLIYRWRFAPGSDLIFVWKNSINTFSRDLNVERYTGNRLVDSFVGTVSSNQTNTFNIKVLYFLDYLTLFKPRSKSSRPS